MYEENVEKKIQIQMESCMKKKVILTIQVKLTEL